MIKPGAWGRFIYPISHKKTKLRRNGTAELFFCARIGLTSRSREYI